MAQPSAEMCQRPTAAGWALHWELYCGCACLAVLVDTLAPRVRSDKNENKRIRQPPHARPHRRLPVRSKPTLTRQSLPPLTPGRRGACIPSCQVRALCGLRKARGLSKVWWHLRVCVGRSCSHKGWVLRLSTPTLSCSLTVYKHTLPLPPFSPTRLAGSQRGLHLQRWLQPDGGAH